MKLFFSIAGFLFLAFSGRNAEAAPQEPIPAIGNEIIYQIITDRFADGDASNNCGQNDKSLTAEQKKLNRLSCDPSRKDWNKYWGGDFAGIERHLPYLKSLGVTRLWISPVIENARGLAVGDGTLKTAYHGFWGRDWFRLNEHWTQTGTKDWKSFKQLVRSTKENGMGLILDTVLNHTSPAYDAENGAIYENGKFISSITRDKNDFFHPYPGILWNLAEAGPSANFSKALLRDYLTQHDLYPGTEASFAQLQSIMLQKFKLADLADLNEDNPAVISYMNRAHHRLLDLGISGFRMDTARHMPISTFAAWTRTLRKKDSGFFVVGEWFGGGPDDPRSMEFVQKTGMTIFDFELRNEFRELFLFKKDLARFGVFLSKSDLLADTKNLVTFIDNHDLPRLMSEGAHPADVTEAMKLLFTVRGIPCIYYGTEVFLGNKTEGGRDPYNREAMIFPEEKGSYPGIELLRALAEFRKAHPALRFGKTIMLTQTEKQLTFKREWQKPDGTLDSVIIAVSPPGEKLTLPEGFKEVEWNATPVSGPASPWTVRIFTPIRLPDEIQTKSE